MERYIKANRKVVELLQLTKDRTELQDGNYILWCQDILQLGEPIEFEGDAVQNRRYRHGWQDRLHGAGKQSVQQAACSYRQQIHHDRAERGGRK